MEDIGHHKIKEPSQQGINILGKKLKQMFSNGAPTHYYEPGTFKIHKCRRKDQYGEKGITGFQNFTPFKFHIYFSQNSC